MSPSDGCVRLALVAKRAAIGCAAVGLLGGFYLGVIYAQVRIQAGRNEARPADAIMVLGAAQWDGRPSPVLAARLDHALELWRARVAPVVVVTGGKLPADRVTEATASADYLIARGVPDAAILREVQGASTYESIAAAARFLVPAGRKRVVLVSDPYHMLRSKGIAAEVGLRGYGSPTRTSPQPGVRSKEFKEALGVAVGRIIGYRRLFRLTG